MRARLVQERRELRIGIVVVAYNAASTLLATLDRIPVEFRSRIRRVIVCDDASADDTFELGRTWGSRCDTPATHVVRHTKNLGYGGNQKAAYDLAVEHGLDVVVLLHGDGQYAPECLPEMVAPLEQDPTVDAVFGSRMMEHGAARRGGMPLYKRVGNRILTGFENRVLGSSLSEFHSGYRAYRVRTLQAIPYGANSDGFDFDTQIIAQILGAGGRIVEIPIPTYYGDEICYVNGMKYAYDVVRDVVEYKLAARGFGTAEWVPRPTEYGFKDDGGSSHAVILGMLSGRRPGRVLDLGCSSGLLAEKVRNLGHYVVGVDAFGLPGVEERTDEFYRADLEGGIPAVVGGNFDYVIAGDVVEHLADPRKALAEIRRVLKPGGEVLLSVPNIGHWYPRVRIALGMFGYDRRGILDETHLRFFNRSTLRRLVRHCGLDILEEAATGLPLEPVMGGGPGAIRRADAALVRARPTLFAYQYVVRLTPHAEASIHEHPAKVPAPPEEHKSPAA